MGTWLASFLDFVASSGAQGWETKEVDLLQSQDEIKQEQDMKEKILKEAKYLMSDIQMTCFFNLFTLFF